MSASPVPYDRSDPIIDRIEDQIGWYDRKSLWNQHMFKGIKVVEIVAAAFIPFLSALKLPNHPNLGYVSAALGGLITVLEGLLHLNQYQQNWLNYRSTCEQLKHEKFVYLAGAPPYAGVANPRALLAERVESLVSQENARWAAVQQSDNKGNADGQK